MTFKRKRRESVRVKKLSSVDYCTRRITGFAAAFWM